MNNREVIIQGEGILNLIPQRPPIVMVDSFFGIEKNHSYSGLTVTADNIFYETGKLQEAGIIEHIAQSAAARIGFLYTRQGEKVPLGFIGSVDKLKIYDLPYISVKTTLCTANIHIKNESRCNQFLIFVVKLHLNC